MKLSPEEVGRIIAQSRFDVNEEIAGSKCRCCEMMWSVIQKRMNFSIAGARRSASGSSRERAGRRYLLLAGRDQAAAFFEEKDLAITSCGHRASDSKNGNCSGIQQGIHDSGEGPLTVGYRRGY
jgi:hypothetical protein